MHLGFATAAAFWHAVAVGRRIPVHMLWVVLAGFVAADRAFVFLGNTFTFCAFHSSVDFRALAQILLFCMF